MGRWVVLGLILSAWANWMPAQSNMGRVTSPAAQSLVSKAQQAADLLNRYWDARFRAAGFKFVSPPLAGFSGAIHTGCGDVSGPAFAFYCPDDRRVYFEERSMQLLLKFVGQYYGGDAADAITLTLAHEWGHAVHDQLNRQPGVRRPMAKTQAIKFGTKAASVGLDSSIAMEGEADCMAGAFVAAVNGGVLPHGGALSDSSFHGSSNWLSFIQDGGPNKTDECLKRALQRYPLRGSGNVPAETIAEFQKCSAVQLTEDAHGDLYYRTVAYAAGQDISYGNFKGPLHCGPLVNGWLARSPARKVNLGAYCAEQFGAGSRAAVQSSVTQFLRKQPFLPLDYLRKDIFCVEDLLNNVPDH